MADKANVIDSKVAVLVRSRTFKGRDGEQVECWDVYFDDDSEATMFDSAGAEKIKNEALNKPQEYVLEPTNVFQGKQQYKIVKVSGLWEKPAGGGGRGGWRGGGGKSRLERAEIIAQSAVKSAAEVYAGAGHDTETMVVAFAAQLADTILEIAADVLGRLPVEKGSGGGDTTRGDLRAQVLEKFENKKNRVVALANDTFEGFAGGFEDLTEEQLKTLLENGDAA